jgi:hypothetical protein
VRTNWFLRKLHQSPTGERHCAVTDNEHYIGAVFWESIRGGPVQGWRYPENHPAVMFQASSVESALVGIRDAFQVDHLDRTVRLN